MSEEKKKIVLPKALQVKMMKFFLEAAVRREKQKQLESSTRNLR